VLIAIRFRSCRTGSTGQVVDLELFSVLTESAGAVQASGSRLTDSSGDCTGGFVFVQVPERSDPHEVVYAADPEADWPFGS
jgi:hypothetical protein